MVLNLELYSVAELCILAGGSEKLLFELRDRLQEWLKLQPHLPQDVPKRHLEWILVSSKMSLERAKQKLDMYYTIRRLIPEIFANRDPRGPAIASLHSVTQFVLLPKLGPGTNRTSIVRFIDPDPSKYSPWDFAKYVFMCADVRINEDRNFGEIIVIDLSMINVGHLAKLTPTFLNKIQITALNAYAARLEEIHIINAPTFVNHVITWVKSILTPKLAERLHVHPAGNLESFYQFVPKSTLPKDYGGDQPTMTELSAALRGKVEEWRDWFLEQEKILVDESLRPGPAINKDSLFGSYGSFRKLDVD